MDRGVGGRRAPEEELGGERFFPQVDADAEGMESPWWDLHAHPLDEVAGDLGSEGVIHDVGGEEAELEEGAGVGLVGRETRGARPSVDGVEGAALQELKVVPTGLGIPDVAVLLEVVVAADGVGPLVNGVLRLRHV